MTDAQTHPEAPRPSMSRGLRWLLILSLALNLMVAGIVGGLALRGGPDGRGPRGFDLELGPFARALDPDDRRAILADLRGREGFEGRRMRELTSGFVARLGEALRAEPFDPAAVRALLAEQRGRLSEAQAAIEAALSDRIAAMSDEERAEFAERLEREIRGRH